MAFSGFGKLIDILKENHQTIVFTEGNDPRILEASSRLLTSNFLEPILLGNEEEIQKITDGYIKDIDEIAAAKEKEILEI